MSKSIVIIIERYVGRSLIRYCCVASKHIALITGIRCHELLSDIFSFEKLQQKKKVAKKLTPSTRLQVKTREKNIDEASVYKTEEILPLTAVVAKLREANTSFTVCFNCKVKE